MTSPLTWTTGVTDIPARGLVWRVEANAVEREAVRAALDVRAVEQIGADGRIEGLAGGRYRFRGMVTARLTQACVVTLDDVPGRIEAPIAVEFRPNDLLDDADMDFEAEDDIEPIMKGTTLETGRVVYEILAANLDPYPRAPGADTEPRVTTTEPADGAAGPFAALAKLKKR
jgi:uncharacterized metal-binding protein YceD (DUF177 family)